MVKKLTSLALTLILAMSLCACGQSTTSTSSLNKEYVDVVKNAAVKLNETYTDYIITTTLNAPDGDTEFIEVVHDDISYTEYSIDADSNLGTLSYGSSDTMSYVLTDWLDSDGKYYIFSSDETGGNVTYYMPDTYKKYVEDRIYLHVNDLLDNATEIKPYDDITLNLGNGDETFKTYKIKVKGDSLKEILGSSSYGVYKSIVDDKESDANVSKLCEYYLEDLNMSLTFSDSNVIVGIDSDGILKYICLETGGLGTRLYFTKAVVSTRNSNLRGTPEFKSAVDYRTTLTDLATYVADYDNYDDALKALENYGVADTVVSEDINSTPTESVEEEVTTEETSSEEVTEVTTEESTELKEE